MTMHIELDSDKLYKRKITTSQKTTIVNHCCNCFLEECYEFGCIGETSEGYCECQLNHNDHPIRS